MKQIDYCNGKEQMNFFICFLLLKNIKSRNAFLFNYEYKQVWNIADFATIQGVLRADGNKKGIFTRDRWLAIPDFGYKSGK